MLICAASGTSPSYGKNCRPLLFTVCMAAWGYYAWGRAPASHRKVLASSPGLSPHVPRSLSPRGGYYAWGRAPASHRKVLASSPGLSPHVPRSLSPRGGRAPKGRGDERFLMLRTNTKSVYYVTYEYKIRILHHLLKCCCPVDRTQFTKSGLTWRIRFDKQALLKTCVLLECY